MKYKFISTDYEGNTLTMETSQEGLHELVQQLRLFLLGVGFGEEIVNVYIEPD